MILLHRCTVMSVLKDPAKPEAFDNPVARLDVQVAETTGHFSLDEAAAHVAEYVRINGMEGHGFFYTEANELSLHLMVGEAKVRAADDDDEPFDPDDPFDIPGL